MKIVNIIGGLGNQMFQYAFAIALKQGSPKEEVKVDTQLYQFPFVKKYKGNYFYHNGYEINKIFPNANLPIASPINLIRWSYYIPNYILFKGARRLLPLRSTEFIQTYEHAYCYDSSALNSKASFYEGYWMSPCYFNECRDAVLRAYSFRPFNTSENKEYEKMLSGDNSVTIHIRRGDYVGAESFKDICTLTYYRNAIEEVKKVITNPVFFIFSNDQQWCMENLKQEFDGSEVHFVTNNRGVESYRDMQLMSLARCNILANSSFSWWGAYLNQREDHIVFCPNKWVNNLEHKDHYVDDWIKIPIK